MLILARRENQSILIGDDIRIFVVEVRNGVVRLGVDAPKAVVVVRDELLTKDEWKA